MTDRQQAGAERHWTSTTSSVMMPSLQFCRVEMHGEFCNVQRFTELACLLE